MNSRLKAFLIIVGLFMVGVGFSFITTSIKEQVAGKTEVECVPKKVAESPDGVVLWVVKAFSQCDMRPARDVYFSSSGTQTKINDNKTMIDAYVPNSAGEDGTK